MANTKKTTNTKFVKKTDAEIKEVKGAKNFFTSKNFLIILGVVLLLILVIFYIYRVNKTNETEKYSTSYWNCKFRN